MRELFGNNIAVILVCLGVGFLFLVGIGVGVFFLIKHNNKEKLQESAESAREQESGMISTEPAISLGVRFLSAIARCNFVVPPSVIAKFCAMILCLAVSLFILIGVIPAFAGDNQGTWSTDSASTHSSSSANQSATPTDDTPVVVPPTTTSDDGTIKQFEDQTTDLMSRYGMWMVVAIIFGASIFIAAVTVFIVFMVKRNKK
jgi:hypothetical protein